ncbi:unnamed protein product [Rhizophagus irregularis]|nr:unnamed protein product [Rhizophagus irregularis]
MLSSAKNDPLSKKERYQIEICQDGKLAVTFDTANLRIRVLDNTDHRQFGLSKKTTTSEHNTNNQNDQGEEEITKTIAYFKINENLDIAKFYDQYDTLCTNRETGIDVNDDTDKRYRWEKHYKKRYERINEDFRLDLTGTSYYSKSNETKKGTAVYRLKLIKENNNFILDLCPVTYYYSGSVSGICKFIQNFDDRDIDQNNYTLKRFVVLNFNGIYNFEYDFDYRNLDLNTRFDYPKSIENELQHWHKENLEDCMDKLLACLYDQYFLVEQYKNNVQALEVYDLADMSLKTTPKRVEKDKHGRKFNRNTFSVSKLQICFTRGINSVNDEKLLIMGKKNQVKLVIWDIYNTVEATPITLENFSIADLGNRLARTSGNILHVDEVGKVTSVLKKIENKLNKNTPKDSKGIFEKYTHSKLGETPDRKADEKHTIHYDKGFEPIVIDKEPWVMDDWQIHGSNLASSP